MPGGKHENMQAWTPEEDQIILTLVEAEGPKWSRIVQRLPGRTVSSVRNRWQRIEKGRKLREQGIESKNRCHACGEPKRGHVCKAKLGGGPKVRVDPVVTSGAVALMPPMPIIGRNIVTTAMDPVMPLFAAPTMPAVRRTRSGTLQAGTMNETVAQLLIGRSEAIAGRSGEWPGAQAGPSSSAHPVMPMVSHKSSVTNKSFFEGLGEFAFGEELDEDAKSALAAMAAKTDGNVPPAIQRAISSEASAVPPKVTRSISSFFREFEPPAARRRVQNGARVNSRAASRDLLAGGLSSLNNLSFSNVSFGANSFGPAIPPLNSQPLELPANLNQDFGSNAAAEAASARKRSADMAELAAPEPPPIARRRSGGSSAAPGEFEAPEPPPIARRRSGGSSAAPGEFEAPEPPPIARRRSARHSMSGSD